MRLRPDLVLKRVAKNTSFNKQKKEKPKQESKELPPPLPEKPEPPGDCCGSGYVWDVYYEEVEAYNKLYKTDFINAIPN